MRKLAFVLLAAGLVAGCRVQQPIPVPPTTTVPTVSSIPTTTTIVVPTSAVGTDECSTLTVGSRLSTVCS